MREMKDSGIKWLGDIPADWEAEIIRHLIIKRDGGAWGDEPNEEKVGTICLRIADFDYAKGRFKRCNIETLTFRKYTWAQIKRLSLMNGDILIEKSGGGEKTPVGRTVLYENEYGPVLFANFMERIRFDSKKIISNFAQYWFMAWYACGCSPFYINQTTGIQNLNLSLLLAKERICFPDTAYQLRIVYYLDRKCAEIDSLLRDIQLQIDTLEQYKCSIVYEAVTHGVVNAKMKMTESDVWAEIPEDWELKDIKYLFEIVKRIAGKEGYDILSVTQKGLKVKDISANEGQIASDYSGYQFVYPTDYVMNHMDLLTGWVDCSEMFGVTSPDYRVFRLIDKHNNLVYYKYIMQCCYMCRIFYSLGQGVSTLGRWRLQTSSFMNFKIPVPPREQQNQIAEYLDKKVGEIDAAIANKKEQFEVLGEYKKSLIFEYVTGKKEVPA